MSDGAMDEAGAGGQAASGESGQAAPGASGEPARDVPRGNLAEVPPGGPLCLTGRIQVEVDGEIVADTDDVALCRCGHSQNKPFCDGSHNKAGFDDPGVILGGRLVPGGDEVGEGDPVLIICAKNGPLLVRGPLTVVAADGATVQGTKGALCRCGVSSTKPFCDGSHRETGFEAG